MTDSIVTVITPADTLDLTVLATVKQELNITATDTDALLTRWIREESNTIASEMGRTLGLETVQEAYRRQWNMRSLRLSRRPVTDLSGVTVDGTAFDPTWWELDAAAGLLFRLDTTGCYRINWCGSLITVTYSAGYELLGDLPYGIEKACLEQLRHRWAARDRDPLIKSETVPGILETSYWVGGTGDNPALVPSAAALIAPHREVHV